MKKVIKKEVTFCDCCGNEMEYSHKCIRCGKDHCYNCLSKGKEYAHSVHCSGSGDGFYCNECDAILTQSKSDTLHNAYKEIELLRLVERSMWEEFKCKVEIAEKNVKSELSKMNV